jgi:outer membrane protein assembly factor BamB
MSIGKRSIGVLACCVVLLGMKALLAQDSPQWRGPNRNGLVSGFTAPQTWPKELTQKWKTTVGLGDATPALVGEKLYVFSRQGEDEVIRCLNAADGQEAWQYKYKAKAISGPAAREHAGPRSSPAVAEGKVITLGIAGVVTCVDVESGKLAWQNDEYKDVPRFYTSLSPVIVEGMAIVHLGGPGKGAVVAFDLADGKPKWTWNGDGPAYASPVIMTVEGTKQFVSLTDKNIIGIDIADGKLLWQLPFAPQGMSYNAATPLVDGQTVIYTGQGRGTKAIKVEKQGDKFVPEELWSNSDLRAQFSSPVLENGLLYGLSDRGLFFCLDAKTGKAAWTDTAKHGSYGGLLGAGPVVLALPNNSELIVFKADNKQFAEVAHYKVASTSTFAAPVISGNRIFIKDQDAVTLWTLE